MTESFDALAKRLKEAVEEKRKEMAMPPTEEIIRMWKESDASLKKTLNEFMSKVEDGSIILVYKDHKCDTYAEELIKNIHYEWNGTFRPVCGNCCMFRPDRVRDTAKGPYCALDGHSISASDKGGYERLRCWLPDNRIPGFIVLKFIQGIGIHDRER